jgi:fumarate reductase flavoprotein subunit
MGGVRTKYTGESVGLRGLFAAGEAACWDLHGFNRLGGNSVAETVVAGMLVGEYVSDFCDGPDGEFDVPTSLVREHLRAERARLDELLASRGTESADALRIEMQQVMSDLVGIFRVGTGLEQAVAQLERLLVRSRSIGLRVHRDGVNPELATAYRTQKMLKVALTVAAGALARTESRGAHHREDFPRRDDAAWLKRTLATWRSSADTLPTLSYEPIDVASMELPPGWRGYGVRNHVEHPDTARRQAEVDAVRASTTDAAAARERLMPTEHLLPERWRGANERLPEETT